MFVYTIASCMIRPLQEGDTKNKKFQDGNI